jgi:8-oxo-dGTP pyrophosphatase MutT (NUDIX family)
MRETWEEVGLDLAENDYLSVGALDDREITTSLGKRLLMILSPHVFLYTSPETPIPELQESEVASAHWIPIEQLTAPAAQYDSVAVDISTRSVSRATD